MTPVIPSQHSPIQARSKLELQVLQDWDQVINDAPNWNELVFASRDGSIFQTLEWAHAWWNAYGSGELFVVLLRNEKKIVVGIVPLYLDTVKKRNLNFRVLRLIGDGSSDSDNLGIIHGPGTAAEVTNSLFDYLLHRRQDWDFLEFSPVVSESRFAEVLKEELASRRSPHRCRCWARQVIHFRAGWEEYLASLSKKMKTGVSYQLRRIQSKHSHALKKCESEEQIPRFLDVLFALHAGRWGARGKAGAFHDEKRRSFYLEVSREFLKKGWLDFWLLELDGSPVAAEYGFHVGEQYSFLQGGFDHNIQQLSVGLILKALVIQELLRMGIKDHDFLGGGDEYKQRWGAAMHMYSQFQIASGAKARLYLRGSAWVSRIKSALPEPVKRVIKRVRGEIASTSDAKAG